MVSKSVCIGCDDDFYNGKNDLGIKECWSFSEISRLVERRKVSIDKNPPWDDEPIVTIPDCYHEKRYIFVEKNRIR